MLSASDVGLIRTTLGDVPADAFGHTQCHEHIALRMGPSFSCNPALLMDDETRSSEELLDYKRAGGSAIVDAQPLWCGRDASMLRRLSAQTGVHIVASTGFHKRAFFEPENRFGEMGEAQLTSLFVREIEERVIDSDEPVRAGIVKVAFEEGATDDPTLKKLLGAAAAAVRETGAALLVHTEPDTDLFRLLQFLAERGVAAERTILCHVDRTVYSHALHEALLETGVYLCYDSIHRYKYLSDEAELTLICRMLDTGHADRMLLSLDTTNTRLRRYYAMDMGLDDVLVDFIPKLKRRGISEETLFRICALNARRVLALSTK